MSSIHSEKKSLLIRDLMGGTDSFQQIIYFLPLFNESEI